MRTAGWLIFSVVLTAGCAQAPVPPTYFYRIYTEEPQATPSVTHLDGVLVVRRFLADGLVSERSVVYGEGAGPNPLQQYHYHSWTESPTRMLQELLVPYLRSANVATEVITPEIRFDAKFEISGKIKRLEQIRGPNSRVIIELEFGLSEPRAGRLIWIENYVAEVECGDSILSAVEAFNQAVSQIYSRLVDDIRKT